MARRVAIFDDAPDTADIRRAETPAHLAYLDAHADEILIGGGLRPSPDGWYCGGLWVMEVADRARAVRLCDDDPFFKAGLRRAYRLYVRGKALPDASSPSSSVDMCRTCFYA
jgi:uncharacterized protein YciI